MQIGIILGFLIIGNISCDGELFFTVSNMFITLG
jgi:hypothetical protein